MPSSIAARIREAAYSRETIHVMYATPADALVPTPVSVLDQLESDIGAPLPPEVRSFYLGTGRLGLVWQEGQGKETSEQPDGWADLCNTDSAYWRRALWPSRALSRRGGMICIPTAAEVFRKGYWLDRIVPEPMGDELTLDGRTIEDATLYENLYPFDFITTYHCAGLWHDRETGGWRVVLGGDHGACWDDHGTLSVAEYFEQLERGLGGPRVFPSRGAGEPREIWALRAEE